MLTFSINKNWGSLPCDIKASALISATKIKAEHKGEYVLDIIGKGREMNPYAHSNLQGKEEAKVKANEENTIDNDNSDDKTIKVVVPSISEEEALEVVFEKDEYDYNVKQFIELEGSIIVEEGVYLRKLLVLGMFGDELAVSRLKELDNKYSNFRELISSLYKHDDFTKDILGVTEEDRARMEFEKRVKKTQLSESIMRKVKEECSGQRWTPGVVRGSDLEAELTCYSTDRIRRESAVAHRYKFLTFTYNLASKYEAELVKAGFTHDSLDRRYYIAELWIKDFININKGVL
jgi:hypothetical protein